jgi:lipopolysaccharide transport system permease protein
LKQILQALWKFRHFVISSIQAELKRRFARSSLGALWFILHPLMQAAIFALVLSEVLAAKLPGVTNKASYAIYLMAGMAAWGFFSEIVNRCTTIFIEYAGMLKKISFPDFVCR